MFNITENYNLASQKIYSYLSLAPREQLWGENKLNLNMCKCENSLVCFVFFLHRQQQKSVLRGDATSELRSPLTRNTGIYILPFYRKTGETVALLARIPVSLCRHLILLIIIFGRSEGLQFISPQICLIQALARCPLLTLPCVGPHFTSNFVFISPAVSPESDSMLFGEI